MPFATSIDRAGSDGSCGALSAQVMRSVRSAGRLRRLARTRAADAFTVESSAGQRSPDTFLRVEHVERIKVVGGAQLTLDVAVRQSSDLALLSSIADRITSL